jgi:hypothetical protein
MALTIVPIFQKQAKAFIRKHHRHHGPSVGSVFQLAVSDGDKVCAALEKLYNGLAKDGIALEGFVDALKAANDYRKLKLKRSLERMYQQAMKS